MVLSLIFGINPSVCSLFLRYGRRILLEIFKRDAFAAVRLPTDDEIMRFQDVFKDKHSLLVDMFAAVDGFKVYLEQSKGTVIQNMFYNAWKHDDIDGNVLVFTPNGTVISCALNVPVSMHDSQIQFMVKL